MDHCSAAESNRIAHLAVGMDPAPADMAAAEQAALLVAVWVDSLEVYLVAAATDTRIRTRTMATLHPAPRAEVTVARHRQRSTNPPAAPVVVAATIPQAVKATVKATAKAASSRITNIRHLPAVVPSTSRRMALQAAVTTQLTLTTLHQVDTSLAPHQEASITQAASSTPQEEDMARALLMTSQANITNTILPKLVSAITSHTNKAHHPTINRVSMVSRLSTKVVAMVVLLVAASRVVLPVVMVALVVKALRVNLEAMVAKADMVVDSRATHRLLVAKEAMVLHPEAKAITTPHLVVKATTTRHLEVKAKVVTILLEARAITALHLPAVRAVRDREDMEIRRLLNGDSERCLFGFGRQDFFMNAGQVP